MSPRDVAPVYDDIVADLLSVGERDADARIWDVVDRFVPIDARRDEGWEPWLRRHFPYALTAPFASRHRRLWDWFDALRPGVQPRPRVESWPRGGAKSWTAETGTVRVGIRETRRFALYVCSTQAQANKHVQAIAAKFEQLGVVRAINAYGSSLGWRLDMLRVANGFSVLALGLDVAGRGVRIEDYRPDLIILDDVDDRLDTRRTVDRKLTSLSESVLPMGSADCAVVVVQNRMHDDSIVTRMIEDRADILVNREVFEEPAVVDLAYDSVQDDDGSRAYVITAGVATWEGQSLEVCARQLNTWGLRAFMREAQHDTGESEGGVWIRARDIDPYRVAPAQRPGTFVLVGVAVDPNAGGEDSDEAGIVVGGIVLIGEGRRAVPHGFLLEDATVAEGPRGWAVAAVEAYERWEADVLIAEKNNGGEMVAITIGTIENAPPVELVHASRGKRTRAEPIQSLSEQGLIHHVGVFVDLERELCTWRPGDPSPNRLDAYVWLWTRLMLRARRRRRGVVTAASIKRAREEREQQQGQDAQPTNGDAPKGRGSNGKRNGRRALQGGSRRFTFPGGR